MQWFLVAATIRHRATSGLLQPTRPTVRRSTTIGYGSVVYIHTGMCISVYMRVFVCMLWLHKWVEDNLAPFASHLSVSVWNRRCQCRGCTQWGHCNGSGSGVRQAARGAHLPWGGINMPIISILDMWHSIRAGEKAAKQMRSKARLLAVTDSQSQKRA